MLLPIPLWFETIIWIWVGGVVVNLPFWYSFAYRTDDRYIWTFPQFLRHADLFDHVLVALLTLAWFLVWPFLAVTEVKSGDRFFLDLVGAGLGNQRSLKSYLDHIS